MDPFIKTVFQNLMHLFSENIPGGCLIQMRTRRNLFKNAGSLARSFMLLMDAYIRDC